MNCQGELDDAPCPNRAIYGGYCREHHDWLRANTTLMAQERRSLVPLLIIVLLGIAAAALWGRPATCAERPMFYLKGTALECGARQGEIRP